MRNQGRGSGGFSLIELIVVIVIAGIMAAVVGLFIAGPIQGFLDQARRAELVDAAQLAFIRMGRDLRASLPNSVRTSAGAIEMLNTVDGDRYRHTAPGGVDDQLQFDTADRDFNTFAQLGAGQALGAGLRLAVYPTGQPGADPYQADLGTPTVMTPSSVTVTIGGAQTVNGTETEYRVSLSAPGHRFPYASPSHRVFLVDGPVSYVCDTSVSPGELLRYSGYALQATQPTTRAAFAALAAPPTPIVVAKNVDACSFQYSAGTEERNAVVALGLSLTDPTSLDEHVRLIRQVHLDNSP